jgi:N-acetylglucosaminyl-diphospho-decaprenol L-rhamnosyltransferase
MAPTLDVVIVNWNAGSQLRECLESLHAADARAFILRRVTVVDNASTDRSLEGLDAPAIPLAIIRNARNMGFAAACNQAASGSDVDFVLFLNPDTRVLTDSIDRAVAVLSDPEHSSTGICGIQLVDDKGRVSRSCARLPTLRLFLSSALGLNRIFPHAFRGPVMAEWDHAQSRRVDHVIGAFYLIRGPLFQSLGGFDERFFVYLEDLDLSARARAAGYGCWYLADAKAFHKGGGTSERVKAMRLFYSLRSRILYGYKHFGFISASLLMLVTLLVEPLIRLGFAVFRRAGKEIGETARAYALLWRDWPRILGASRQMSAGATLNARPPSPRPPDGIARKRWL